jgi:hypothetical protein
MIKPLNTGPIRIVQTGIPSPGEGHELVHCPVLSTTEQDWRTQKSSRHSESLGSRTIAIVRNSKQVENTTFRKLRLFPSSGEEGKGRGETHSVGSLRRI